MRIGIDARFLEEAGLGRYIKNLLINLQRIDSKNEYFVFLKRQDFDNLKLNNNFHKVLADFSWYGASEQIKFPPLLKKYNLDLVHFPHFNIPIFYKDKFVVTIHDLTHLDFKMKRASTKNILVYNFKHLVQKKVLKIALEKSQKIFTPSEYVKKEIIKRWGIKTNKIIVTHEAVEEGLLEIKNKLSEKSKEEILEKFEIKSPFIFYVGNAHPHKNIEGLIEAFLIVRKKFQYLQLVLSGKDNYFWQRIKQDLNVSLLKKDVIFTGIISDEELVVLYNCSKIFVYPSFSEGFGLPLLEAMACNCPVASSNLTSLPEIANDAAVYFDPKDPEDMAEKIIDLLSDEKLRKELIEKGEKRYKQFNWDSLAQKTLEGYER